jgi:hypothetical protein
MGVALFEALYFYTARSGRVTPKRVSELKHTVLYFFILAFLFWFKALVEGLFRAGPGENLFGERSSQMGWYGAV